MHKSKFTPEMLVRLREAWTTSTVTKLELVKRFGISYGHALKLLGLKPKPRHFRK